VHLHSYTWQHKFIFTRNTKCWKQKTRLFLLALKMNHNCSCFTFTKNKRVLFSSFAKGWVICVDASTCIIFRYFMLLWFLNFFIFSYEVGEQICIYGTKLTDDMTLSNELQNAISALSVVQTLTSKTAKEFEFRSLQFCK
jgi:hypothetical protein